MALWTGTNYHPHDWGPERWDEDIKLMKKAGIGVVRLGHLCWDSYEPENGVYTFEWFDRVMNAFAESGIRVFLDVTTRPAPLWVHRLCPGCDIYSKGGNRQAPLRRYMEDVDDPDYQYYALRFARVIVNRYKNHPALMGFGLCNEQGDGPVSYSPAALARFRRWLQQKYKTVGALNKAWNTQRWSRRLTSFADVELPENEIAKGSPEAYLDMRRFYGDGVLNFMKKLKETVEKEAPGICHSSNHVAESDYLGFDYLKGCREFVDYPGFGFYPNLDPEDENTIMYVLMYMQHRLAELDRPMWCLEFQTGNFGCMAGQDGLIRMYALLCLAYRTQMVLAWTWRSMLGGEEQFCFGLLDHDGTCGRKYQEFTRIASDFKKLETYSLPYLPQPETAIAYCYENIPVYDYAPYYYRLSYKQQVADTLKIFHRRNLDVNMVDLRNMRHGYKMLLIPGHALITEEMAQNIRDYVAQGGMVIMTAYSAKVDGTNTVFGTPQPGLLTEVFGIRAGEFLRSDIHPVKAGENPVRRNFCLERDGNEVRYESAYWETLELAGAQEYACYTQEGTSCAVSVNRYGKGKAFYTASEANTELLGWLYDRIAAEEGLQKGIPAPEGVVIRKLSETEYLLVNTTTQTKEIKLPKKLRRALQGETVEGVLILPPLDGELLYEEI